MTAPRRLRRGGKRFGKEFHQAVQALVGELFPNRQIFYEWGTRAARKLLDLEKEVPISMDEFDKRLFLFVVEQSAMYELAHDGRFPPRQRIEEWVLSLGVEGDA